MIRCFLLNAVVLIVAIATWFYFQNTQKQLIVSINQIRDARVQLQHTEQQLYRLEEEASKPLLTVLGEDVTTLQIRLAEFLTSSKIDVIDTIETRRVYGQALSSNDSDDSENGVVGEEASGVVVAYEQYLLPDAAPLSGEVSGVTLNKYKVRVLRLDVQLKTAHAPHLLGFIQQLETATGGWPMDVRACEVHRSVQMGLSSRCIVDIYHWTVSGAVDSISQGG